MDIDSTLHAAPAISPQGNLRVHASFQGDILSVQAGENTTRIALFDLNNREVLRREMPKRGAGISLDLPGLKAGVYYLQVRTHKGTRTLPVVKLK